VTSTDTKPEVVFSRRSRHFQKWIWRHISENGGYDQGRGFDLPSSPAYNVEPVTNTSSSSCANNGRRMLQWVLNTCRRSSRLCFSHFATRTVDNSVDAYAGKPDIRPESRFLPILPAFDAPVRGIPAGLSPPRFVWENYRIVWLPDGENISKISLFVLTQLTNVTDTQTDRHHMTA